ncbi:MAG TPA: RidA family protein, partial [Burkholderiaceae bacterium]|nr:RidA family protein [Burkholderiaceae bacterium]
PQHIVRMTWYLLSRDEYVTRLGEIGAAYRELMSAQGNVHYPVMTAVQVAALIEPQAKVELEVTAMLPD